MMRVESMKTTNRVVSLLKFREDGACTVRRGRPPISRVYRGSGGTPLYGVHRSSNRMGKLTLQLTPTRKSCLYTP